MTEKDNQFFIEHIIESIEAIEEFSKELTLEELQKNRMKRNAILKEIEMIGEAANNLSQKFQEEHNYIEWPKIIAARNKIIHHYFAIDNEIIFEIITQDIPVLKINIKKTQ